MQLQHKKLSLFGRLQTYDGKGDKSFSDGIVQVEKIIKLTQQSEDN